jgi:hypothetical protein
MKGVAMKDTISTELDRQVSQDVGADAQAKGTIGSMAGRYDTQNSDRLLGLLLKLDFAASHIVTCDPWKHRCGGAPRGAFVVFRIDPRAVGPEDVRYSSRLILARIVDEAPTPVDLQTQQMLFQVHKLQATLDPLTLKDLQWSALKASIVGTYYDDQDGAVMFGNDVDTYFAPFVYVAFMPTVADLGRLINAFVDSTRAVEIGNLRYTETPGPGEVHAVPVQIDPQDLVGELNAAQRTANFGKTRFGKSNTTKIFAHTLFSSGVSVSQLFIDPSGEYTYINSQDGTSLFALNHKDSVRYSLRPRQLSQEEQNVGLKTALPLAISFYDHPDVGHQLILTLWDSVNASRPGYVRPILDWSPIPPKDAPQRAKNVSGFNHYWRTMGMYYALLSKAGFEAPSGLVVPVDFPAPVKAQLAAVTGVVTAGGTLATQQPISVLPELWKRVHQLWSQQQRSNAQPLPFPPSQSTGEPYFNDIENSFLRCLGEAGLTAHNYFRPFNVYHNPAGSSIFKEVVGHLMAGKSVFVDVTRANEVVVENLTREICKELLSEQMRRFAEEPEKQRMVLVHFEEAHRLFRSDDKDLTSIYNVLAKEGGKFNIAMAYSTQSVSTVSPDLTKNTDNFFLAHLDDDREIREVARKYVFRDVAQDLERTQTKGYVRLFTRSHRFALPVQIHRFGLDWATQMKQKPQSSGGL